MFSLATAGAFREPVLPIVGTRSVFVGPMGLHGSPLPSRLASERLAESLRSWFTQDVVSPANLKLITAFREIA